ncbi:hypothetical protein GCM10010424_22410 [Streptomyces lienomycini]
MTGEDRGLQGARLQEGHGESGQPTRQTCQFRQSWEPGQTGQAGQETLDEREKGQCCRGDLHGPTSCRHAGTPLSPVCPRGAP